MSRIHRVNMDLWHKLYVGILLCWKDLGKAYSIRLCVCARVCISNMLYSNTLQSDAVHSRILNLYIMFFLMERHVKWTGDCFLSLILIQWVGKKTSIPQNQLYLLEEVTFLNSMILFLLDTPCSWWDLNSLTRDWNVSPALEVHVTILIYI